VATWAEFAATRPEMAGRGAALLGVGVAFIATTASDGSARVHPFTPLISEGRLLNFIATHTVKYHNLRRDARYSVHAMLGKDDEEFMITGRAVTSDDWASRMSAAIEARKIDMISKDDVVFEFTIEFAHWAIWRSLGTPDIRREAEAWRAG
jgi:hypothetical protein